MKVDNSYYDKVRQLSDASGESLLATSNGVVAAGLGELKGLGDVLKQGKVGKPVDAAVDPGEELEEEEGEEEEDGGTGWFWFAAAVVGILALRYRINQASIAR